MFKSLVTILALAVGTLASSSSEEGPHLAMRALGLETRATNSSKSGGASVILSPWPLTSINPSPIGGAFINFDFLHFGKHGPGAAVGLRNKTLSATLIATLSYNKEGYRIQTPLPFFFSPDIETGVYTLWVSDDTGELATVPVFLNRLYSTPLYDQQQQVAAFNTKAQTKIKAQSKEDFPVIKFTPLKTAKAAHGKKTKRI